MFLFEVCRMVVKPERVRASQPKSHTGVHAIALQLATFSLLVKEVKVIVVRGSQFRNKRLQNRSLMQVVED